MCGIRAAGPEAQVPFEWQCHRAWASESQEGTDCIFIGPCVARSKARARLEAHASGQTLKRKKRDQHYIRQAAPLL